MFKKSKQSTGIQEDRVGGSFGPWESGAYPVVIDMAYLHQSEGGAYAVNFTFKTQDAKELRQTIYVTNKKGETFYTKEGKDYDLPGYLLVNSICLLTVGKALEELDKTNKTLKIYSFVAKSEVPTEVPVFLDLIGETVTLGLHKVRENKNVKQNGKYVPTNEERILNEVDKVFQAETNLTVSEIVNEQEEAEFYAKWVEKNDGVLRDKYKAVSGGGSAAPMNSTPSSPSSEEGSAPKKNLFGKK